jgi:hypothetical protein
MNKIRNTVAFLGRLATLLVALIFIEGMFTMGSAYNFSEYSAMGWIAQTLGFVVCVWAATEWHYESQGGNQ